MSTLNMNYQIAEQQGRTIAWSQLAKRSIDVLLVCAPELEHPRAYLV